MRISLGGHILGLWIAAAAGNATAQGNPTEDLRVREAAVAAQERQRLDEERRRSDTAPTLSAPATGRRLLPIHDESPCFVLTAIGVVGMDAVSRSLKDEFEPFRGHCAGGASLAALRHNLNQRLADEGFITSRVALPEQELASGMLRAEVMAGRVEALMERAAAAGAASKSGAWQHAISLRPGDVLNVRALDQALDHFNRLSGQKASFVIEPGSAEGLSQVVLRREVLRQQHANAGLDNSAAREYGRTHAHVHWTVDAPLGVLDRFDASLGTSLESPNAGDRSQSITLRYSVPLLAQLFSLNLSHSRRAREVLGTTLSFRSSGADRSAELRWQWSAWRDASRKLGLWSALRERRSASFIDDTELVVQRSQLGTLEVGATWWQRREGLALQLELAHGRSQRTGPRNPFVALDELKPRLDRMRADLSAALPVGATRLAWSAQLEAQNLRHAATSADRLVIGGRGSVRGFSGDATLSGESGFTLQQELSGAAQAWAEGRLSAQPYVALDCGLVRGPSSHLGPGRALAGIALGLRISSTGPTPTFSADLALAAPLYKPRGFDIAKAVPYLSLSMSI